MVLAALMRWKKNLPLLFVNECQSRRGYAFRRYFLFLSIGRIILIVYVLRLEASRRARDPEFLLISTTLDIFLNNVRSLLYIRLCICSIDRNREKNVSLG